MRSILFLFAVLFGFSAVMGQEEDPVLFTVENNPVQLSEFNYIYNKNNGDKANYSAESIDEYLNLYVKFKLKVQKAKDMKLDTIVALQKELEGYRRELANSYLTDKEVTERLVQEVYDRQGFDVRVRHILVNLKPNANQDQQKKALEKITELKNRLDKGEVFNGLARKQSEDKGSNLKGGDIGFLAAMLPNGFYELENAIFTGEEGEVMGPVKSKLGYHLVKIEEKRPARGEIMASHILLRKKKKNKAVMGVKEKIDSVYNLLQAGASFEDLAKKLSEDKKSATKGGDIGAFGINKYESSFENAAFGLEKDGDISMPIETSIGWHIIKKTKSVERMPYEKAKRFIQAKITKDERFELARQKMIENIKTEANFKENTRVLEGFIKMLDAEFYSYKWEVPMLKSEELFSLGDLPSITNLEFANYCKVNTRQRLRMDKKSPVGNSVKTLYESFINEKVLKYEEKNLEKKYPDFKALMREYEEGILLFEATKINVWDRASEDTTGLQAFYENNREKYAWKERALVETYKIDTEDPKVLNKIMRKAKKWDASKLMSKFNVGGKEVITVKEDLYERGSKEVAGFAFAKNAVSFAEKNDQTKSTKFRKIKSIQPSALKTMNEAKGYIVADYQDYLEEKWVESLKKAYSVDIDESVLKSIIK